MAPEYAMRGYLTDKADVYSFGIVALEIVSGRSNTSNRPKQEPFYLLDWVTLLTYSMIRNREVSLWRLLNYASKLMSIYLGENNGILRILYQEKNILCCFS